MGIVENRLYQLERHAVLASMNPTRRVPQVAWRILLVILATLGSRDVARRFDEGDVELDGRASSPQVADVAALEVVFAAISARRTRPARGAETPRVR